MRVSEVPRAEFANRAAQGAIALRVGPFVARLGSSVRPLVNSLHFLYRDYPLGTHDAFVDFDLRVDPPSPLRRWIGPQVAAYVDGVRRFAPFPRSQALPMFEWMMNWCIFTIPNQFLILHAGVMEKGGQAAILSGRPGAGKSTLCAGLALRGWRLLSDEVGVIRPGSTDLKPVPRPIALKEESIEVIRSLSPEGSLGPSVPGTRKGTVAHLRAPRASIARCDETARPRWIVFPEYVAGAEATMTAVPRARAFLRLAGNAFNYSLLGRTGFETLADVLDRCEAFELRFGSLQQAVDRLEALSESRTHPGS